MNASESKDPSTQQKLYRLAAGQLEAQKKRIKAILTELNSAQQSVENELSSFPKEIQDHKDFKPHLTDIEKAIGYFKEIRTGVQKESEKIKKVEGKLPK